VRDFCGTSGQVETPNGAKRQEAHRTPRGKRAPGAEINRFQQLQIFSRKYIQSHGQIDFFAKIELIANITNENSVRNNDKIRAVCSSPKRT
jgi:hypothetical protein